MKAFIFCHTFIENVASKIPVMYAKEDEAVLAYRKAERHFFQRMKVSSIFSPALHVLAILIILTIQLKIILFRMLQLSLHDSEIVRYIAQVMHCSLKRPGCRFFSKILLSVGIIWFL